MDLSVVVVNWNAKDYLEKCLASIFKNSPSFDFEVMVVDNASTDGSQDLVKTKFPQTKLILNKRNLGYSGAANRALGETNSPYLFLLNSDTEVLPGSLELMVEFGKNHPQAGAIGPMLVNADGTLQYSCRKFPSFKIGFFHALLSPFLPDNPYSRSYRLTDFDHRRRQEVDWISGASLFLKRKALEEVGFFDEGYFMYGEDLDLCFRLKQAGWKTYYYPEPKIKHYVGKSSRLHSPKMIIEHHKSIYRFLSKVYRGFPGAFLRYLIAAGLIFRAAILLAVLAVQKGVLNLKFKTKNVK